MLQQNIYSYHYKICENGHLIYQDSAPVSTNYCRICGAQFVTKCDQCSTTLASTFSSSVYFTNGKPTNFPSLPGACSNCGRLFPWTLKQSQCSEMNDVEALSFVINICRKYHNVAKQLRVRYKNRETLDIADEYDVQDLLHALLRVNFDDIRPEEWTPSYAGGSARVDFLIKPFMILVEVKKTRKGLSSKEVGDQLIEDIARYKQIKNIKSLICFVYDPDERLINSTGLISDLEALDKNLDLHVVISPER